MTRTAHGRSGATLPLISLLVLLISPASALAQQNSEPVAPIKPAAANLDELLERVRQGWNAERAENKQREADFRSKRDRQKFRRHLLKEGKR